MPFFYSIDSLPMKDVHLIFPTFYIWYFHFPLTISHLWFPHLTVFFPCIILVFYQILYKIIMSFTKFIKSHVPYYFFQRMSFSFSHSKQLGLLPLLCSHTIAICLLPLWDLLNSVYLEIYWALQLYSWKTPATLMLQSPYATTRGYSNTLTWIAHQWGVFYSSL